MGYQLSQINKCLGRTASIIPLQLCKIAYLLLFGAFFVSKTLAQPKCSISHYSTEDGLSDNRISTILKDRQGFMWFGTWSGLNRYDGQSFVVYRSRPGDSSNLENNRIDRIYEDNNGFLWLKTNSRHIYRFDKKTGQFFDIHQILKETHKELILFREVFVSKNGEVWLTSDKHGAFLIANSNLPLPSYKRYPTSEINFFHEDHHQRIWIGTKTGLHVFAPSKIGYQSVPLGSQVKQASMTAFAEDKRFVWLANSNGYLYAFDKFSKEWISKKISNFTINNLCISKVGYRVYCSTKGGELLTVEKDTWNVRNFIAPNKTAIFTMYEDRKGRLWINPDGFGIFKFDFNKKQFSYYTQRSDVDYTKSFRGFRVFEDNNGLLWAIMKGGGFGYYDEAADKVSYFYNDPNSNTKEFANSVTAMYYDTAGIMWLSTYDRGLHKVIFHNRNFELKAPVPNVPERSVNDVRSLLSDKTNRLWVATKGGELHIYKNGRTLGNIFINPPSTGLGLVYVMFEDKKRNIWLGTKGDGLYKAQPVDASFSKYKLTQFRKQKGDSASNTNVFYTIAEDNKGRIWAGSYGNGISVVQENQGKIKFIHQGNSFKKYPSSLFSKVRSISFDEKGRVWIGTTNGLLIANANQPLANMHFATYTKIAGDRTSLGDNDVQYIYRDASNQMWVATACGGLNKAIGSNPEKKLRFQNFSMKEGLPNDYIASLTEDNKGFLWLATQNGLSKFDKKGTFRNYNSFDGLPTATFSEGASSKLPDGTLVFGMISGVLSFDPDRLVDRKINRRMAFTHLQINNEDMSPGNGLIQYDVDALDKLTLPYHKNIVSIDYGVLDFRAAGKESYKVRLVGFDNSWNDYKDRTRATYTNLPPGNYVFEVKSSRSDLYSNVPQKKLEIVIMPPIYRTWWAYILYALITLGLLWVARRTALIFLKLRQGIEIEKKLTELKLHFFTNISHELRTPLTLIQNPVSHLLKDEQLSKKGTIYAQIVKRNVERMERFISQLLELRKVQSGNAKLNLAQVDVVAFVEKVCDYFAEALAEKETTLSIDKSDAELLAHIDADKIETVLYNVLANAIKFGPTGGHIGIEITLSQNSICKISVRDQGPGVNEKELQDIFKLYYEGDFQGNRPIKGTGIGLSISREFMELHHGKMYARNVPGAKGLVVIMEFQTNIGLSPSHQAKQIMETAKWEQYKPSLDDPSNNPDPNPTRDKTELPLLLLVEDNADMRLLLSEQLEVYFRINTAENGQEGLAKANQILPDLILTDLMMPVMDGIAMLDQIKNNPITSHIPVVLLTAKSSVESRVKGLQYGADYYLTKPFDSDFLLAVLNNLLLLRKRLFNKLVGQPEKISQIATTAIPAEFVMTKHDELFLQKVKDFVEIGLTNPQFSIDAIADTSNMSRSAFYRKFKSLTAMAPVEFVRQMRLEKAKQLFDQGEAVVSEVAFKVGFDNANYFGICFKQYTGHTASTYIKHKTRIHKPT